MDTLGSGSLQNPGPRPSVCAFGLALVHLLTDYRTGLCTRVTKPVRNLAETSTSKEVDGLPFVSACLGHAGVNFQRWAALFLLEASSWTQCHLKSRWIGPETACTYFKSFEASHHKSPSSSVVGGDTSLFEIRAGGRMLIARCRDGEAAVYGDGRESKCAFGAINFVKK